MGCVCDTELICPIGSPPTVVTNGSPEAKVPGCSGGWTVTVIGTAVTGGSWLLGWADAVTTTVPGLATDRESDEAPGSRLSPLPEGGNTVTVPGSASDTREESAVTGGFGDVGSGGCTVTVPGGAVTSLVGLTVAVSGGEVGSPPGGPTVTVPGAGREKVGGRTVTVTGAGVPRVLLLALTFNEPGSALESNWGPLVCAEERGGKTVTVTGSAGVAGAVVEEFEKYTRVVLSGRAVAVTNTLFDVVFTGAEVLGPQVLRRIRKPCRQVIQAKCSPRICIHGAAHNGRAGCDVRSTQPRGDHSMYTPARRRAETRGRTVGGSIVAFLFVRRLGYVVPTTYWSGSASNDIRYARRTISERLLTLPGGVQGDCEGLEPSGP